VRARHQLQLHVSRYPGATYEVRWAVIITGDGTTVSANAPILGVRQQGGNGYFQPSPSIPWYKNRGASSKSPQLGFTLIELLTALGIFSLICGAAFTLLASSHNTPEPNRKR